MAVLEEWGKLAIRSFLMTGIIILCMTTMELMAQPASDNCKDPLGMESGAVIYIRDDQITASSAFGYLYAYHGRLHGNSLWQPSLYSDVWIQVDFERTLWVTGVATQGNYQIANWVTAYSVQHRKDGMNWNTIEDYQNRDQIFQGNVDGNTEVRNNFTNPISLRYIRIYPTGHEGFVALRLELYGCEEIRTTSSSGIRTEIRTAETSSSHEIEDERSRIGLTVGVAAGSVFILLVIVVAIIKCRKDSTSAQPKPMAERAPETPMSDGETLTPSASEQRVLSPGASDKLTEKDIRKITHKLSLTREQLTNLYKELDLKDHEIQNAERNADTNDFKLQGGHVLGRWRSTKGNDATKGTILQAMKECDLKEAMESLMGMWDILFVD